MTITLESNFMLLGDRDAASIDLDRPDATLAKLLEEISGRSTNTVEFFAPGTDDLQEGWEVQVNGLAFADLAEGLGTTLHDGDCVTIRLALLGGG